MGMTSKELNVLLQRHGLFADKQALALLKEHVDKSAEPKAEVAAVVQRIKSNTSLVKNKVPKEVMEEVLAVEGDAENDASENLMILDHKDVPISVYDSVRKVMVRKAGTDRSVQENVEPITRIQAFRERFDMVEQRVQNNHIFAKKAFAIDEAANSRPDLTRISGVRRAEGEVCMLALLTQPHEGTFYLEDPTGRVEVDITGAEASMGLFTENCIIIAEGLMKGDVFVASCLAMPPAEDREVTCARFPAIAVPTNRKPYTPEELAELQRDEQQQLDTQIVVLSDVWLDRPKVMGGLRKLFGRFDIACHNVEEGQDVFFLFVLMGNFVSQPSAHGVGQHKELFDKLATLIASFEALLTKSLFVIVPGPNDVMAGNGLMLPRNPLPNAIARGFKEKVPACTFASNPCRIKFYTQELVFHRDDVCAKMRKYSRKPSEGKELKDHAVKTLLSQGHLAPLPLHAAPIDWAYDHALRLYPLPTLLVLGDRVASYDMTYQNTQVTNPGCFASDFSFTLYSPVDRTVNVLYIDQVDEIPDSERTRRAEELVLAKKRKDKKRKEKKAAREMRQDVDEDGNPVEKRRTDSKTPKTRKKVPQGRETAADDKGAITTFFARRPARAEEEEQGDGERSRRRLRQRADSDDSVSDDDSDAEGGAEGESGSSAGEEAQGEGVEAQDSEEEGEAGAKLQRRALPVQARAKRNRMEDSDEEEEVDTDKVSKTKTADTDKMSKIKTVAPVVTTSKSDDADAFVYRPSARAAVYSSY